MLTRKLTLKYNNIEVGETPMLLPSVSSRVNLPLPELLQALSEIVYGPLLLSVYDIHFSEENLSFSFPDLLFLDSGGYECNKDQDVSDIGLYNPVPHKWDKDLYLKVVDNWSSEIPTILVSYDNPDERKPVKQQIKDTEDIFRKRDNFIKEILIKPETEKSKRINVKAIINNIKAIGSFDIIGFTDKELGFSILDRMVNIGRISILTLLLTHC